MAFKPAPEELKRRIRKFMDNHHGKMYQVVPHPEFAGLPVYYDDSRLEIIEPHLRYPGGTVLDIGTNWGRFAHWLEDLGYRVTAVERGANHAYIARGIREICGKTFEIIEGSVFDMETPDYDIVLALNIFHHFLKRKETYDDLVSLLQRLECRMLFLQVHRPGEDQMASAYRNLAPQEFVDFVSQQARLPHVEKIGEVSKRPIFKLWKDNA